MVDILQTNGFLSMGLKYDIAKTAMEGYNLN